MTTCASPVQLRSFLTEATTAMTTAHRATYKAAKATYNGIEQGNYFTGGVGTTAVAARDLPGQKSLKRRMIGQRYRGGIRIKRL